MKYYILKELVQKLDTYTHIKQIKRTNNNTLQIEFNDRSVYYFDMTKGNASVYKKHTNSSAYKDFNAPFDVMLKKRFIQANITKAYLYQDDKVINIDVLSKSSYKSLKTTLQLEFTGKHTNIIILDENRVVLDALRHVDSDVSSRIVKVGQVLEEIPQAPFVPKMHDIEDIDQFLYDIFTAQEEQKIQHVKKQKISLLQKERKKIQLILNQLEDKEVLENKAQEYYSKANLLLANLHNIEDFNQSVDLMDFEGRSVCIELEPQKYGVKQFTNVLFDKAKKLKQKALNQYQEKQNLEEKLEFTSKMMQVIEGLDNIDEIEFYFPKKQKNQKKTKKAQPYQSFFFQGYKIMLGRDERENIFLLKNSKASDFWFHLKDRHSSHVIVINSKKSLPQAVIEKAAVICAKFSVPHGGNYLVDYTQRRNVDIQQRASVLYNPYQTIGIIIK
ncbi:MAG: NFACT RNA binding domain-containing protein [Campylobacterota bacterium]|nr:NFACT RNA binding domain-containing protein [Campylobacterota bacterium]